MQSFVHSVTEFFSSQSVSSGDFAVVAVLVILEGALSIDNALVLSLLAKRLAKEQRAAALNWGMTLAFIFRFIAIFTAALLLRWTIVKFLGGAYLVYIAVRHLFFESPAHDDEKLVLDEHGHPQLVEPTGHELSEEATEQEIRPRVPVYVKPETTDRVGVARFWPTVASIGLTDIAFAVDSILAAIALVGPSPNPNAYHPKLWVVFTGGGLGMVVLRFAAGLFIKLMEKFPRLELSAYLLVLVIGCKLLADWGLNSDWSFGQPADMAQRQPGWRQSFASFDDRRRQWAEGYEQWLDEHWPLKIPHEEPAPLPGGGRPPAHVLDFHALRRPETIAFWLLMVTCFAAGFLPSKRKTVG